MPVDAPPTSLALQTIQSSLYEPALIAALVLSWLSTVLCIVRGVPVVMEAFRWENRSA